MIFLKKVVSVFLVCFLVSVLGSPVSAYVSPGVWDPQPYTDVPSAVLTPDMLDNYDTTVRSALQSSASAGLKMLGPIMIVFIILSIVGGVVRRFLAVEEGVRHREFTRKVHQEDVRRNFSAIVEDKELDREVNFHAKALFRRKNPFIELGELEYNRKLHAADRIQNRESIIRDGVEHRKLQREIRKADYSENFDDIVDDRVKHFYLEDCAKTRLIDFYRAKRGSSPSRKSFQYYEAASDYYNSGVSPSSETLPRGGRGRSLVVLKGGKDKT